MWIMAFGGAAFLAYLGAVPLLLRHATISPATLVMGATAAVCVLALAGLALLAQPVIFWAFLVSYWFFVLCFLMVFRVLYKSISLRIVRHLSKAPRRGDSSADLFSRYVAGDAFQSRLQVILARQYAVRSDGHFGLADRRRRIAGAVRLVQGIFGIDKSG